MCIHELLSKHRDILYSAFILLTPIICINIIVFIISHTRVRFDKTTILEGKIVYVYAKDEIVLVRCGGVLIRVRLKNLIVLSINPLEAINMFLLWKRRKKLEELLMSQVQIVLPSSRGITIRSLKNKNFFYDGEILDISVV